MTQQIDPVKLKAAAEHLEWVCQQYPDNEDVQYLYQKLFPVIEDAKAGRVVEPVERFIPFRWAMSSEGIYDEYKTPDVGSAYLDFATELEGGLSDAAKEIDAIIENIRKTATNGGQS
jgi:hypothetical protein